MRATTQMQRSLKGAAEGELMEKLKTEQIPERNDKTRVHERKKRTTGVTICTASQARGVDYVELLLFCHNFQ